MLASSMVGCSFPMCLDASSVWASELFPNALVCRHPRSFARPFHASSERHKPAAHISPNGKRPDEKYLQLNRRNQTTLTPAAKQRVLHKQSAPNTMPKFLTAQNTPSQSWRSPERNTAPSAFQRQ